MIVYVFVALLAFKSPTDTYKVVATFDTLSECTTALKEYASTHDNIDLIYCARKVD